MTFSNPLNRLISEQNLWPLFGVMDGAGTTLVTADAGAVRKWNMNTGRYVTIEGHTGAIAAAAITPDSKTLLTGSWDHSARVWNLVRNVSVELTGHTDWVTAAAVSTFGAIAATGSHDKTVRLWDLTTGRCANSLAHDTAVTAVALSPPKEGLVASGAMDGSCKLWNISGTHRGDLKGHAGPINCMAFFPDSPILITGSEDGTVRIWNPDSKDAPLILKGHDHSVTALTVFNTHQVITGDAVGNILIHELTREKNAVKGKRALKGHDSAITFIEVTLDGETVVTGSFDRTIRFHRFDTLQLSGTLHYLSKGFLWSAPPDDLTKSGDVYTDRKELVSVIEVNEKDGDGPRPLWDDEYIENYIKGINNGHWVLLRINDFEAYRKTRAPRIFPPGIEGPYRPEYLLTERLPGGSD